MRKSFAWEIVLATAFSSNVYAEDCVETTNEAGLVIKKDCTREVYLYEYNELGQKILM